MTLFSLDLSVDTVVGDDDLGFYAQFEPYRLEFQIGDSIFFQTDQYGFLGYRVSVETTTPISYRLEISSESFLETLGWRRVTESTR